MIQRARACAPGGRALIVELTGLQRIILYSAVGAILVGGAAILAARSQHPPTPEQFYSPPASQQLATIVIHVKGAVNQPGLYTLYEGARAYDAIVLAGGFAEDADQQAVNLAAMLEDGQELIVPVSSPPPPEPIVAPQPSEPSTLPAQPMTPSVAPQQPYQPEYSPVPSQPAPSVEPEVRYPISLNHATLDELMTIPGIGRELAQRILYYRYEHGGFRDVSELKTIEGIGDKKLTELHTYVVP